MSDRLLEGGHLRLLEGAVFNRLLEGLSGPVTGGPKEQEPGFTIDDLLDLRVGQRVESFRFDLVDTAGNVVGLVQPNRSNAISIENDVTRTIKRTMSNFSLDPDQQAVLTTANARIRPSMLFSTGDERTLGVFLFADASRPRRSWGLELSAQLLDLGYILDQPIGRHVSYPATTNVVFAARDLAAEVVVSPIIVTTSGITAGSPLTWAPDATRTTIMTDLLQLAGYLPPYFDNDGNLILRPVPNLTTTTPDIIYEAGGRIIDNSIVESDDLLKAPNRYIVIDTSATASPIVGQFDIPASAPNSIANRGFPVVKVINTQGLQSVAAANAAAQAYAQSDSVAFRYASFNSALDPRHDTYNVVQYLGTNYLETRWSMTLQAGGTMSHEMRQVYVIS